VRSEELTPAEFEAELRANLAAKGEEPAEWLVDEIRSGAWKQRQRQNMRNLQRNQVRLVRLKREGYTFDAEHRLVAPALTRIDAPLRRDVARPRERRPRNRSTRQARAPSRDPDEPEPPLGRRSSDLTPLQQAQMALRGGLRGRACKRRPRIRRVPLDRGEQGRP
jgi:hypothetical protein